MRGETVSLCERDFVLQGVVEDLRLDGRKRDDFREVKLAVGREWGSSLCCIGNTKVLCAVSAQLAEPSRSRPQKGIVSIEVDMSPMGNFANEHNRLGERGMELTKLLELVLRDSRCVDIESLCVRTGEEVWKLRVDVRVLDDDGSLLDCASIAAVTSLQHMRRPNVSVEAHHTLIHSQFEKALVPVSIYHMPICVSFGFTSSGHVIMDPTETEQCCIAGSLVIACNKRREVCALHQSTNLILSSATITSCIRTAMQRSVILSELVSEVLKNDAAARAAGQNFGFELVCDEKMLTSRQCQPNELSAPAIRIAREKQSRIKSNFTEENPLASGSVVLKEDEDKSFSVQIEQLMLVPPCVETVAEEEPNKPRQKDSDDLNDLLDGLSGDELGGETMALKTNTPMEIDLSKTRKRK